MNKIQANASGTRSIEVSDKHLQTLKKYSLLKNLIDSNGIIDEDVLDKLKFNCRSILESQPTVDKELMDLCLDVIYNNNMKPSDYRILFCSMSIGSQNKQKLKKRNNILNG